MSMQTLNPGARRAILAGLALAAVLYVNFFTRLLPFTYRACAAEAAGLEETYRQASKDLNKARQATHRLPYLEKEYLLLHQKWEQSRSLLPEREDMAWCLRTISLLGTQTGVQFTLFKPLPPKPAQHYTEHPIEITVQGGYHEIGAFLGEVANLDRVIQVQGLEIRKPKQPVGDSPAEASFVAVPYTLGGTGVPPEAEEAPGGKPKAGAKAKGKRTAHPPRQANASERGGSAARGEE